MKKKFTFLIAAAIMLLTLLTQPLTAVGQKTANSYTIEFQDNVGGSDQSQAITSLNDIVKSGDEYVTSISGASKVYHGKDGFGVKMGSSSSQGTFTMNLSTTGQVTAAKIYIYAAKYGSDTGNINIQLNGSYNTNYNYSISNSDLTGDITEYEWVLNSSIDITSVKITSTKRGYVHSIKVEMVSTEPSCEADVTTYDFSNVNVGQTASHTFTITTANLTDDIALSVYDATAFTVSPTTIAAGATTTDVTVTFHPTLVTEWTDGLKILSDDFDEELIELTGAGLCNAPANALAFATPVNLTLSSSDGAEYTLAPLANTGNGGSITYAITTNPDDAAMMSDEDTFWASETGTYVVTATQALNGTTCGATFDITINVNGEDPVCTITPDTYEFGTVLTNSTHSHNFTVTTANLESALTVAIDNMDKGFSVSPTSIAQGATSTTVTVTYAPTTASAEVTATLSITGGGLASDVEALVSGTATNGYTVTFNAGTGTCTTTQMTGLLPNEVITLPLASTVTAPEGWTFAGWCATNISTATTTQPDLLTGSYTVTGDVALYAVYSKTEGAAEESDVVLANGVETIAGSEITYTEDFITIVVAKGSSSNWYSSASAPRWYVNNVVTMTPGAEAINSIVIEQSGSSYDGLSDSNTIYTNASVSASGTTATITPEDGSQSITITLKKQSRPTKITVNYGSATTTYATSPAATVATPSIQIAGVSTGATNSYYETATVTIGCATDGAAIHYTTNGDEPTASSTLYTAPFAVTSTSTIKAIAVKANFNNSDVASQEVIIVEPNVATFTNGVYESLNSSATFNDWYTITVLGDAAWEWNSYGYARIAGSGNNEVWLISPRMAVVNGKLAVSFDCVGRYANPDQFEAFYSTNYPGYGNPNEYTWTEISETLPYDEDSWNMTTINVDITGLSNVYFAFRYLSTTSKAGILEVKNFAAKQCYPVTYDGNGATSGEVTDANSPYAVGSTVTVKSNEGGFVAPTGTVFNTWNTDSEGEGTQYNPGAEFTMGTAAVTLYAQWIAPCTDMATMDATTAGAVYVYDSGDKSYKVTMSSDVTALGGCDITEYGFVYSTSETTPTIADTKLAVGTAYTTVGTEFESEIANATGTYYVRAFATNAAGTAYSTEAVTVVVPSTYPTYTISYSTNGVAEATTTTVDQGDAISSLAEPTAANVPMGYTFTGWYNGTSYSNPTTAPDYVKVGDAITGDIELKAVFAVAGTGTEERNLNITIDNFTEITTNYSTEYTHEYYEATVEAYGVYKNPNGIQMNKDKGTYIKNTTAMPGYITKFVLTWTASGKNSPTMYVNANSEASTSSTNLGTQSNSVTVQTITIDNPSTANYKFFYFDGTTVTGACYMSSFKIYYMGATTVYSNYCTSVTSIDLDEDVTIASGETYNLNYVLTIESGKTLTVEGTLNCTNPANLIIEEGGQLITSNSVKATVEKSVHASEAKTTNNWYVISSPVDEVEISSFVSEAPDKWNVYRYDETEVEWEEYRDSNNLFSTLANGRGYLYRSTKADINFVGDVNVENAEYQLTYTSTVGDDYAGFHLIGNPFTHNIYKGENGAIDDSDNLEDGFYTLSSACAWVAGTDNSTAIAPTQAILVQAKSTANGETLYITNTTAGGPTKYGNNQIMFAVKNAEYSDVAYVLFKEGHGLNKVEHRNADIPMLYVINNGEEFAIADMPDNTSVINLGFEAKTMGQYTISLKAEGQYSYMHLIDKLTGEDTDMLVEDSYTFVGSQSDRNDRFVLRLNYNAAGIDSESDIFAYQNGNDIIVRGEGTLQVFDITGRMVMSTRIDGVETINGIGSGVYIFRMEGKTQKIVVR